MLVLSRKKDEAIRIGDEITIKVIAVKGGGVRLGIDAPIEVSIVRSELLHDSEQSLDDESRGKTPDKHDDATAAESSDRRPHCTGCI